MWQVSWLDMLLWQNYNRWTCHSRFLRFLFYFNVFVRILWFRFQPQKITRQNSKEPKLNTIHGSRTRTKKLNHRKSNLASIASLIGGNSKESC